MVKTIKIIDLLNKIANGEEVPNTIKYRNKIYNYEKFNIGYGKDYFNAEWKIEKGYRHTTNDNSHIYLNINDYHLNDEVEILEEENKIKKLYHCYTETDNEETKFLIKNINDLSDKFNEVIDEINKLKENK